MMYGGGLNLNAQYNPLLQIMAGLQQGGGSAAGPLAQAKARAQQSGAGLPIPKAPAPYAGAGSQPNSNPLSDAASAAKNFQQLKGLFSGPAAPGAMAPDMSLAGTNAQLAASGYNPSWAGAGQASAPFSLNGGSGVAGSVGGADIGAGTPFSVNTSVAPFAPTMYSPAGASAAGAGEAATPATLDALSSAATGPAIDAAATSAAGAASGATAAGGPLVAEAPLIGAGALGTTEAALGGDAIASLGADGLAAGLGDAAVAGAADAGAADFLPLLLALL